MSILKFTSSADTTITDAFKPYTTNRAYYANMGAADSLEIFSIVHSGSSPEKSRILVNFPITEISASRSVGKLPQSGSVNFIFKLFNVAHTEILPRNYDVVVKPISGSWDEGYGLDLENYSDNGQTQTDGFGVGWKFKSTTDPVSVWASDGGDFYSGYDKVFHLDTGLEDIEIDITDIVEDQISGMLAPNGIAVMLSGAYEDGTNNTTYYTKRFSARSSEYFYKTPRLEARWETVTKDDRGDFYFSTPNLSTQDNDQSIYFYNKFGGILKNLPGSVLPLVKLEDENGNTIIEDIASTLLSTGIYKATVNITGSEDAQLIDTWYSGSSVFHKGIVDAKVREFGDSYAQPDYVFSITNLKNSYKNYEFPTIKVFGREKNWSPNVYKIANSSIEVSTFKNLYYKIIRIVDNMTVIDYGIEPIPYTKCSYDKNGNYFDLDMSFFEPGYGYGIKLMLLDGQTKIELPNIYRFKVE